MISLFACCRSCLWKLCMFGYDIYHVSDFVNIFCLVLVQVLKNIGVMCLVSQSPIVYHIICFFALVTNA